AAVFSSVSGASFGTRTAPSTRSFFVIARDDPTVIVGGLGNRALLPFEKMDDFGRQREAMVRDQLVRRGISDARVLEAMKTVPRDQFVDAAHRDLAYADEPVDIGEQQTISQPYIVAKMVQEARIEAADRVLEVGTGSGYAAAVAGVLARDVYSLERIYP